ncbi:protein RRP6-like 3 isoform X1 [Primulina eburnea]|uniref:protein RRP6-like 3 isoform X1 n=2 Tax=Primulina eburnea TaxID=1245227 RepID=UPI003C6BF545
MAPSSAAMAMEGDKLSGGATATAAFVAFTCFFALAVSVLLMRHLLVNKKRVKSCYLNTEPKPQSTFKRVLTENSYSQFKHLMLQASDVQADEECTNLHPYKGEISRLIKNPNVGILECLYGDDYECGVSTMGRSFVWVDSEAGLRELVEVLSQVRLFAVDTEQHSFRSFLGFTALVQISTKRNDYLVDTIRLHDMMGLLRPAFANPGICKVFHGADNDIIWLQRDFHIYVVNLFDTAKACDVLSKPQRSLAYLLETYCRVSTNKVLQREDWRRRPLSEEMIQYARTDAHYLLYIAHRLCLELHRQRKAENLSPGDKFRFLLEASRRSNATCLQLFTKDVEACPGELAAASIISRCMNDQEKIPGLCNTKFQEIVKLLCTWRDIMARLHDESLRFVLSENAIIALATKIPKTEIEICSTISKVDEDSEFTTRFPYQSPSPVVCSHLEDLIYLLRESVTKIEDVFQSFVQQHLGPGGSCPLSAYNYALMSKSNLRQAYRSASIHTRFRVSKQVAKKASRELFVQKFSCKSPVYHNCKIYADDGRLLCYCDRRKLEWYINRNLAKLVEDDPPSIMLLFEPKGRPEDEDNDFYIQSKKNICVGCGEANHYLRYRIIPSCYRIHFPEHLKSHRSHDIVLVCVDCHEIAHAAAEKYKKTVAAEFGIPLFVRKVVNFDETHNIPTSSLPVETSGDAGVSPLELRTAAMALLRHGPQMPSQRREELMLIIMMYYGRREISEEDLERALMVGMSPHERRKFGKKKGYAFKHVRKHEYLNDEEENNIGSKPNISSQNASRGEILDSLVSNTGETDEKQYYDDILMVEDTGVSRQPSSSCIGGNNTIFSANTSYMNSVVKNVPGVILASDSSYDNISGNSSISKEITSAGQVRDSSLKHESKVSLLGHGPHGKQVVEYLLKEYGPDGINQFCQRWRQVFVEALHPRFLPAGWDVMHSGKRDFGEFSVYSPAYKVCAVSETV